MNNYTMIGGDLSHHNYGSVNPAFWDFVMLKATEGRTYQDPKMDNFLTDMALATNQLPYIGFYHYARPENNLPGNEVDNFLTKIKPHIGNCMMALDVEGDALKIHNLDEWCMQWCERVRQLTGVKPMIYTSSAYAHLMQETLKSYPLWIAHYNVQKPTSKRITLNPIMWQFTSKPFDIDLFYGTPCDMVKLIGGGD